MRRVGSCFRYRAVDLCHRVLSYSTIYTHQYWGETALIDRYAFAPSVGIQPKWI